MERLARIHIRQRRTQQSKLGDKCKNSGLQGRGGHSNPALEDKCKDCKAEADTAARSWEINVKDCRAEQLRDKYEGLQARGGERRHI